MLTQLKAEPHLVRELTYWGHTFYEVESLQFFKVVGHPTDNNVRISKKPVRPRAAHKGIF